MPGCPSPFRLWTRESKRAESKPASTQMPACAYFFFTINTRLFVVEYSRTVDIEVKGIQWNTNDEFP